MSNPVRSVVSRVAFVLSSVGLGLLMPSTGDAQSCKNCVTQPAPCIFACRGGVPGPGYDECNSACPCSGDPVTCNPWCAYSGACTS
jgi:hypothetical protein